MRKLLLLITILLIFLPVTIWGLDIQTIEVNQGLGVQLNNNRKFVAGKNTVVRAFLSEAISVDTEKTKAVITRVGAEAFVLSPATYNKPVKVIDFPCPTMAKCGGWAAGNYQFDVIVNGATKSTTGTTYSFVERQAPRIMAVKVKANFGGRIEQVSGNRWKTMWTFLGATYPVATSKIVWFAGLDLDASDAKYDQYTEKGQKALWERLTKLNPNKCSGNRQAKGCYDQIVGFVSDFPKDEDGPMQGYTYTRPANIVVEKDEDAPATVAHEIAHGYDIGDTYQGGDINCKANPAPDGFTGVDWYTGKKGISCRAGRVSYPGVSATKIPAEHHPYEIGGRDSLGDMACFMGTGPKLKQYWITQDTYDWLFDKLAPVVTTSAPLAVEQRFLSFFGYINKAGAVDLGAWSAYSDTVDVPDSSGDQYQLKALDAASQVLASQNLEVNFLLKKNPPKEVDWAPFRGAIRFPDGVVKFQILQDDVVLAEVPVSANIPVVDSVWPEAAGKTISGLQTITWSAHDPDGGQLAFTVSYNPDVSNPSKEWIILEGGLTDNSYVVDFDQLPGGLHAKIRIEATDGVWTASLDSQEFAVPFKTPELYLEPLESTTITVDDQVQLLAQAWDFQDDWLEDSQIVWTSNLSGLLGRGAGLIVKNLAVGDHIITVTATNSLGLTSSDTLTLSVTSTGGSLSSSSSGACFIETIWNEVF